MFPTPYVSVVALLVVNNGGWAGQPPSVTWLHKGISGRWFAVPSPVQGAYDPGERNFYIRFPGRPWRGLRVVYGAVSAVRGFGGGWRPVLRGVRVCGGGLPVVR